MIASVPVRQVLSILLLITGLAPAADAPKTGPGDASAVTATVAPSVVWPLDRTAYFVGEQVPLAVRGVPAGAPLKLAGAHRDGTTLFYSGPVAALMLDASRLAPGDYKLSINGVETGQRLTIVSALRRSAGSMQDEATPSQPKVDSKLSPPERAAAVERHWDGIAQTFQESGLTACFALGADDMGRASYLDVMTRAGALLVVNPDTRPTSFFPVGNLPLELDGMSQRMILTAQANGRYPNFGGFCFGWDTTGYQIGGRKGLMTYWGWGDKTQALRNYIGRVDKFTTEEFTRRTGLQPVTESEYVAYLLAIGRADMAPAIDLPTKLWLAEIAQFTKPLAAGERAEFERRLDAWSGYLMGLYNEAYSRFAQNLRGAEASLRNTASVQIDHAAVRYGQYFPSAYEPLHLQYQTTWNDQVGGPDYAYQWLLTAGLLDMHRGGKRTWLSNTMGPVHGVTTMPGKVTRVAAHGLAFGVSGIGFALEGFSNLLGGMNSKQSGWENIRGQAGEADVLAGREFLDRFAALAVAGRGDHGVGILFSKSQYQRQHIVHGYGTAAYKAFVALTRLGYTPRFVTEEELAAGRVKDLPALLLIGQTFLLTSQASEALERFGKTGGRILVDGGTTIAVPGAEKLALTFPFSLPGKPHSWTSPNLVPGDNDTLVYARWHPELAAAFSKSLGDTGRGVFKSERGPDTKVSLLQIDGGPDVKYIVAVNDSHVARQADWHQVTERLTPTGKAPAGAVLYDCTEEKALGPVAALNCDLTATTARVFGVLARPVAKLALSARQTLAAGGELVVAAQLLDAAGKPVRAVVPLHLTLLAPDAKAVQSLFRSTDREGTFALSLPIAANAPAGTWSVRVRSQLDGMTATLPVTVTASAPASFAKIITDKVLVRDRAAIEATFTKGAKVVLPIFDSPHAGELLPIAEKVKAALARRGVEVEIRSQVEPGTYWLGYDPSAEQLQENARVDAGEAFGKIKRETANHNDWHSALSGYRFGRPVILLDLVVPPAVPAAPVRGKPAPAPKPVNPMASALATAGLLWPQVNESFPGLGRSVVQAVHWAFAPRVSAIVVQAGDAAGLLAAAESLAQLPEDRLLPPIQSLRAGLWKQYHVGGQPDRPKAAGLTAKGLQTSVAPQRFAIRLGDTRPLPADQVQPPVRPARPVHAVPATILPKEYVLQYRDNAGQFIETTTVNFLKPDLRFSEGVLLTVDVAKAGRVKLYADGLFRYSDRKPMWQAQWEDILSLREKLVPSRRQPMHFEARLGDKVIGQLGTARTEEKEVKLELASPSAGLKPRTAVEEVVTRLAGEIELPAGRHEILLVHRHIVDGQLAALGVGMEPQLPPPPAAKK